MKTPPLIDPAIGQALAREESMRAPTIHRRAMANSFCTRHCMPVSGTDVAHQEDRWLAGEEQEHRLTKLPSREISELKEACYQMTVSNNPLPASSMDQDPDEAEFLASENTFSDDEEDNPLLMNSDRIDDLMLNSGPPSLAGLVETIKSALPPPEDEKITRTSVSSILMTTTCTYRDFKSFINARKANRYTPVILRAFNKINEINKNSNHNIEQTLISDSSPVKHYTRIIEHCMYLSFLQLYIPERPSPPDPAG